MSIAIAADAIIKSLKIQMPPLIKADQIGLCSPAEVHDKLLLGVYIYAVVRDINAYIAGNIRVDSSTAVKPPLNSEIRVMITSYAGRKSGLQADYKILERVMQIWHDRSELSMNTALQPALFKEPRMELLNLSSEDIGNIWNFETPYTLSLFYKAAPISIPSRTQITTEPVDNVDYKAGDH